MSERRDLAVWLFRAGLAAADPEAAVRRALADDPPGAARAVLVLAAGKAALRMLEGASDWIEALPRPPEIVVATNRENLAGGRGAVPEGAAPGGPAGSSGAEPGRGDRGATVRAGIGVRRGVRGGRDRRRGRRRAVRAGRRAGTGRARVRRRRGTCAGAAAARGGGRGRGRPADRCGASRGR